MRDGILAEFGTPEQLVAAIHSLHERGYRRIEVYTPYPITAAEEALKLPRSRLPWAIFVMGLAGAGGAYALQWYLNAYLYPLDVGGRPAHMPLAFVPITFEMGILLAAFTAFIGVLVRAGLPRLWHPIFEVDGFERASLDRFWLQIGADDHQLHDLDTGRELEELGALRVVHLDRRSVT